MTTKTEMHQRKDMGYCDGTTTEIGQQVPLQFATPKEVRACMYVEEEEDNEELEELDQHQGGGLTSASASAFSASLLCLRMLSVMRGLFPAAAAAAAAAFLCCWSVAGWYGP